jgi:transposase InsO family protein
VKFAFISAEKAHAPVSVLCRTLEVARSGFYAWQARDPSEQHIDDEKLGVEIAAIHRASGETYGSPRILLDLHAKGLQVSRKRVARLMRELGIRSRRKRRFKATTDSGHQLPVAENVLDRKFEVDAPNVAWVTDITYVWTDEGWLYLATILDLFSRRVVGLAMSERIDRALVLEALRVAVGRRTPDAGLLHHSDRGSQYASNDYQDALAEQGIVCSMSRKGNCWDNAVAESFFATLKTECIHGRRFATRAEAREAIFHFVEIFYNATRRHSTLGYLSPMEFEMKFVEENKKREYEKTRAA